MSSDTFFWVLSRVAGLTCFASLSLAILSGIALRTAVFDWLASNRSLKSTHEFTSILWVPLGLLHLAALLLDRTARISPTDLVVPFTASYGDLGRLAIGLGALSFDLFVVIAITSWLRGRMNQRTWRYIHRLSYLAFALLFVHAVLGGSDFSAPLVSAIAWAAAAMLAVLALARAFWGRLPAA